MPSEPASENEENNVLSFVRSYHKITAGTGSKIVGDTPWVTLPTRESFPLQGSKTDWNSIHSTLSVTGKLYLYSGHFLETLDGDHPGNEGAIHSFWEWVASDSFQSLAQSFDSWDHGVSLRIESSIHTLLIDRTGPLALIATQLRRDISWACEPGNVKSNNHGVFLLGALLLASKAWTELCKTEGLEMGLPKQDVDEVIRTNLAMIVGLIYGDDGWCAENSPMYDRVWINLLNRLLRSFPDELSNMDAYDRVSRAIANSDTPSRAQLLPNAKYVPRGDSPRKKTKLSPAHGTFFSTRVGIWVDSSPLTYIMATSGHASITHKHVDETAIYLVHNGIDLFLDGGFHSYNYQDPRVVALRCGVGHSALGLDAFDSLPPWIAYKKGAELIRGKLSDASSHGVLLEKSLHGMGVLRRRLDAPNQNSLNIIDSWDLFEPGRPVARFLLANNTKIEICDNQSIAISRLGSVAEFSTSVPVGATVVAAETSHPYRGWYSTSAGEFVAGQVLEIRPLDASVKGKLEHNITLSVKDL